MNNIVFSFQLSVIPEPFMLRTYCLLHMTHLYEEEVARVLTSYYTPWTGNVGMGDFCADEEDQADADEEDQADADDDQADADGAF